MHQSRTCRNSSCQCVECYTLSGFIVIAVLLTLCVTTILLWFRDTKNNWYLELRSPGANRSKKVFEITGSVYKY